MEKSSIVTSVEVEARIRSIALPNRLPASPGRSATLDHLISQNEDLMARLMVSLRKNGEWEDRLARATAVIEDLRTEARVEREQRELSEERARITEESSWTERLRNDDLRGQIEKLEHGYAELFMHAQQTTRRLQWFKRYRTKIKAAALRGRTELRRLRALREEFRAAQPELAAKEARLVEAAQIIAEQSEKARAYDEVFAENINLQNQAVADTRRFDRFRIETGKSQSELLLRVREQGAQIKTLLVETDSRADREVRVNRELEEFRRGEERLKDQIESLQILWAQKQRDLDELVVKNAALQKLNQSLGVVLNQTRREMAELSLRADERRLAQGPLPR